MLEDDFEQLYGRLAASATTSSDFDTMVNIDEALGRAPADASWADDFTNLMPVWLEDDLSVDEVYGLQRVYEKVTEYLRPDEYDYDAPDWDERRAAAEQDEQDEQEGEEESWSSGPEKTVDLESRQIDAMFDGLKDANR